MLELPNPFANEGGVIRLLEPPGGDTEALVDSVLAKRYGRPFVIEDDGARCLYFTRDFIQSEMRLDDPYELAFAYTRKMMAFLLFCPEPRRILMIGLGGGSLVKFCNRRLPSTHVTVVEIDDPTRAGQGIEIVDLDAVQEDRRPLIGNNAKTARLVENHIIGTDPPINHGFIGHAGAPTRSDTEAHKLSILEATE